MRKIAIGTGFVVALLAITACTSQPEVVFDPPASSSSSSDSSDSSESSHSSSLQQTSTTTTSALSKTSLPSSVRISVPFAPQAPFTNWDPPYDEACEEASLILVKEFLAGRKSITLAEMDTQIQDLVAWETQQGLPIDITIAQLKDVAEQKYGLRARLLENPSIDDIKHELGNGHPVIVPLAGRDIGNPYYSGEGPWYHMLVIVGYDSKNFITNDVGTKRGEGYTYRYAVLHDAIHDWTGIKEEIRQGKAIALVIE